MASPETEPRGVEKQEAKSELQVNKSERKRPSNTEREAAESDLTKRGAEAEKAITAEREKTHETEAVLSKEKGSAEKEKPKEPKAAPRVRPKPHTKTERTQVFKKEIKDVQAQMSPGSRTFSKVIHNNAVEKASDAAQKTVLRPSALIGGAVLGLGLGLVLYIIAQVYHYGLGGLEILALFVSGAIVGVVVEWVIKKVRT